MSGQEPHWFYRGRVALFAILRSLGLGSGSTVVLQAFTCTAVPEAILAAGAEPIYADLEPDGVNVSPAGVERALSAGADAVVLQHTFGIPAAIDSVERLCRAAGVPLIEDCCHILGLQGPGRVGTTGVASLFSYEWGKPIPVGVGGAAVSNSEELEAALRTFRKTCTPPPLVRRMRLEAQYWAFRSLYSPRRYWRLKCLFRRLSRASLAEGNFNRLDCGEPSEEFGWLMSVSVQRRVRKSLERVKGVERTVLSRVEAYRRGIRSPRLEHILNPEDPETLPLARYPLFADDKARLLKAAEAANVEVAGWYETVVHPLQDEQLAAVGYQHGSCPHAERAASRLVSLPIHNTTASEARRVVRFLNGDW